MLTRMSFFTEGIRLPELLKPQEPALALDAVERRFPLHGLSHVGHVAHDERAGKLKNRPRAKEMLKFKVRS